MSDIIVEKGNLDEAHDLYKAREVLASLQKYYPGHPWQVDFQGRALVVRHQEINDFVRNNLGRSGFGAVVKHLNSYSATQLDHDAMVNGGQMLEAFGLPRGAWRGVAPTIPAGFRFNRPESWR